LANITPVADGSPGLRSTLSTALASLITIVALAWAMNLFQKLSIYLYPAQIVIFVLGLAIALAFLRLPARRHTAKRDAPLLDWVAAGTAMVSSAWMAIRYPELADLTVDAPREAVIIGLTQIVLTLEASRRATGLILPLIVIMFVAYAVAGHHIPGSFAAQQTSWDVLAGFLAFDANALPGGPLLIVCNIVISFVFFGSLLRVTGGADFFSNLAQALMGRFRGGPAKVAVAGSALFGSISGSAVANVAATGVVTIPMIRRSGYSAANAAAIEAVSSTGGQLLPPVMGAAAFLMADFLQVSYAQVVLAALLPGILYYVSLFIQVDLIAGQEAGRVRDLTGGWYFLLPFVAIVVALFYFDVYPQTAAIIASVVLVAGTFAFSYRGLRHSIAQIADAIRSMFLLGSGQPVLLLLLAAVVCIVLGMGLPTLGVYVLLASLVAPGLIEIGITPLAAHLFVMYYGMMSMITPPVAIAAYTAAGLAGANPMQTAWTSVKIGWLAYVIPFVFVFSPGLTLQAGIGEAGIAVAAITLAILLLSIALTGYFLRPVGATRRTVALLAGSALCIPASAFATAGVVLAVAAATGILFLAMEVAMTRRTTITPGDNNDA